MPSLRCTDEFAPRSSQSNSPAGGVSIEKFGLTLWPAEEGSAVGGVDAKVKRGFEADETLLALEVDGRGLTDGSLGAGVC